MTVDGSGEEYLRLPFTVSPAIVAAGVVRLASAWSRYEQTHSHRSEPLQAGV
jgi:hypothetical protein